LPAETRYQAKSAELTNLFYTGCPAKGKKEILPHDWSAVGQAPRGGPAFERRTVRLFELLFQFTVSFTRPLSPTTFWERDGSNLRAEGQILVRTEPNPPPDVDTSKARAYAPARGSAGSQVAR